LAYCTASDVRLVVDTDLTDAQIAGIVEMSNAEIDARIGSQSTPGELVKKLSVLLTAHAIKTRQPQSLAVGEYREDTGDVLGVWEREIERIYRLHGNVSVKASDYAHIDDDERYPRGV